MKFLDCFCGLGGASEGFAREGLDCVGIEINPEIAKLYPYKVIVADIQDLKGEDFKGYDVIWGSPPCREFSQFAESFSYRWKKPSNIDSGLELVRCFLKFVEDAKPKIWIMENVPNLTKYLDIKPRMTAKIKPSMKRGFWGTFPDFLMPCFDDGRIIWHIQGKLRSWERAKIPLPCSLAFAQACKQKLELGEGESKTEKKNND
jgi:site-specific DNA-cytosine methylase